MTRQQISGFSSRYDSLTFARSPVEDCSAKTYASDIDYFDYVHVVYVSENIESAIRNELALKTFELKSVDGSSQLALDSSS